MKVLVIEDSTRLLRSLERGLKKMGFAVDTAQDGELGLSLAETFDYDVIVLDLMLPKLPGLEVLRRLRAAKRGVHVLILSAKDRVDDRKEGLQLGADDYLVKPFSFDELCARLKALVRRAFESKTPVLEVGSIELDTVRQRVSRAGEAINLTPNEYALFEYLVLSGGRVSSQSQLQEHLHPSDTEVSSNVIEVLVSGLRKKIHTEGEPPIVRTRRGFGYYVDPQ